VARRSAERLARLERRAPRLSNGADEGGLGGNGDAAASRLYLRIDTLVAVLSSLATVAVWSVAVIVALGQFNVSLAPLFAGAGVLGIALGFGAQSVVSDFLSGFFMLFEDQFGVGDVVDLGEASGTVENLSLRTTTIRDVNGTVWHIRNSEIRRVGNKSQLWSRAVLDIDVAYDTDIRRAEGIIQRVADELWRDPDYTDGDIIDPPQVWGVENLGADGVTIRLVVKTDPAEQWMIGRELRLRIKEALDEAGIEIPFPQRTIWLRHDEATPREERPDVAVAPLRLPEPSEDLVENPD
jgi:small conductance mechanosensitive channel